MKMKMTDLKQQQQQPLTCTGCKCLSCGDDGAVAFAEAGACETCTGCCVGDGYHYY